MITHQLGHWSHMMSKIQKNGNSISIQGDGFEVQANLERNTLTIQLVRFDKDGFSGTIYKTVIDQNSEIPQQKQLIRDFQHVERVFQCFTNENYFSIDPRIATIFLKLEEKVQINGFERMRNQFHQIHLEQIPMSDMHKYFFKLLKMEQEIKELKVIKNSSPRDEDIDYQKDINTLQGKYDYIRKKSNKQQKIIDFLMEKMGQKVQLEWKRKQMQSIRKRKVKSKKQKVKQVEQVRKLGKKQESSSDESSNRSNSSSSSEQQERKRPQKKVKKNEPSSKLSMQSKSNKGQQNEERKSKFFEQNQQSKSLYNHQSSVITQKVRIVFSVRGAFTQEGEFGSKIISKIPDSRWMQCVWDRRISAEKVQVFDLRILQTKFNKIMIGVVSLSRMRDQSSFRTGKSITYRGEDALVKFAQGNESKKSGRGFEEKDFVRMIIDIKNQRIQWKAGSQLNCLITQAISPIPEHMILEGFYPSFEMFNMGDQIQIVHH